MNLLYEGKAKKVFAADEPDKCVVCYKDDATAFNGQKKGAIEGKGAFNNKITNFFMGMLESHGVRTHYIKELSDRETLVTKVEIIPLEVIVRNIAAGSLAKRLGLAEGAALACTVLEFCYKSDELGDPLLNEYHIAALKLASPEELEAIKTAAFKINGLLTNYLEAVGILLVDFKLEFGRFKGEILLADEISPDTCRFWDAQTHEKLDKDRFRRDMENVRKGYEEISGRLGL
ncbi:MAG: phosphoribosylaminoimidazolesuccinocarboxamide synthase [Clostridiales bacterium]|jgi:phosphoribosylaminoimidazole-succinocarboxamide synthase|nr:phosphoribosylaminoimidazolesuccinocarboxamide synthase [Clostridiales bacterium]